MDGSVRLYRRLDRWLLARSPLQYGLFVGVFWVIVWSVGVSIGFWSSPVDPVVIAVVGAFVVCGFSAVGRLFMTRNF